MQVIEEHIEDGAKSPKSHRRARKPRKHWLDYATFIVGILGLVGLGVYAALTWGILRESKATVVEMQRQTRIDERPWLKVSSPEAFITSNGKPIPFAAGQPLQVPIEFTNYGKTAARKITTGISLGVLPTGEEPGIPDAGETLTINTTTDAVVAPPGKHLIAVYPSEITGAGILEPGENIRVTVSRVKISGGQVLIDPVSQEDVQKLSAGKAYIVLFGSISYLDIFGVQHETKFCQAIPREATLKKCATYNEVDSEDGTKPAR